MLLFVSLFACQGISAGADTGDDSEFATKCLMPGTTDLESSTLNWQNIRFLEDLDFCLLSVAEKLSDADKLIGWMAASGFRMSRPITYSRQTMMASYGYEGEGDLIGGSIPKDEFKWGIHPWRTFPAYSMSVGLMLRDGGSPLSVNSVLNTK
ncbi:hypothetical protein [Ruegeria sp. A3M17]|uniref:hypothetical protein n=1 Tax=Ruegeria sp. A3M17 TaxID=2267229 RepID=UPI0011BD9C29|nr:hypothetical protein [Ruegeria sp. A3M17]